MIYVDARPLNPFAKSAPVEAPTRFYQHSQPVSDAKALAKRISKTFKSVRNDEGEETLFTVPGRSEYVMKLDEDANFELRTRVGEDGGLTVWEKTVDEQLPMRRGLRARIGTRIPRIKPALMTYDDAGDLRDAFSKRIKAMPSRVKRRVFKNDGVQVALTEHRMEEGVEIVTLTLRSECPKALRSTLAGLDVSEKDSAAMFDVLKAAA